jgi:hypothetical protein
VGLATYFCFLIRDFPTHTRELTSLFCKDSAYTSGRLPEGALVAFCHLDSALSIEPLVSNPRPDLDFSLTTDAATRDIVNPGGMRAVLS